MRTFLQKEKRTDLKVGHYNGKRKKQGTAKNARGCVPRGTLRMSGKYRTYGFKSEKERERVRTIVRKQRS
jgi:hypothetical protein